MTQISPLLEGPVVTLGQLQKSFGPCVGAVMGYGEGEVGDDGRLQWCAAVLPGQAMTHFLNRRMREFKETGQDAEKPFLLTMGTLKRAKERGGVPEALFGVGLAAPKGASAEDILHSHHLTRPENLDDAGRFRWPIGVALLRVWLASPPVPFANLTGPHRRFGSSDGNRVVPLDELIPGLGAAILAASLQEAVLNRPKPLSPYLARMEQKWREGSLRYRTRKETVRNRAVVEAALDDNLARHGTYRCEECGYEPITDPKVEKDSERAMLDVHHLDGMTNGERETALRDVIVLCPLCHRREHAGKIAENTPLEKMSHA